MRTVGKFGFIKNPHVRVVSLDIQEDKDPIIKDGCRTIYPKDWAELEYKWGVNKACSQSYFKRRGSFSNLLFDSLLQNSIL
jgi:hypothetical protein